MHAPPSHVDPPLPLPLTPPELEPEPPPDPDAEPELDPDDPPELEPPSGGDPFPFCESCELQAPLSAMQPTTTSQAGRARIDRMR